MTVCALPLLAGAPPGLYLFAYLWKSGATDAEIDLVRSRTRRGTWGFGVVFSEQRWNSCAPSDPDTVERPSRHRWRSGRNSRSTGAAKLSRASVGLLSRLVVPACAADTPVSRVPRGVSPRFIP